MTPNAKEDLPLPDTPEIATILFKGISTSIFFKLCTFAPHPATQNVIKHTHIEIM